MLYKYNQCPQRYSPEDYKKLFDHIYRNLVPAFEIDNSYVGIARFGTKPLEDAHIRRKSLPGIYLLPQKGEYKYIGVTVENDTMVINIAVPKISHNEFRGYELITYPINVKSDGDGTSFLSDDGTYKPIELDVYSKEETDALLDAKADRTDVHDGKLTIKQNGNVVAEFTANQSGDVEADLTGGSEVQSDWTQTDSEAPDFIKNKPIVEGTLTVDITDIRNPRYSTTGLDDLKEAGMYDFRVRLNDSGAVYEYDLPLSVEKIVGTLGTQEAYIQRITVLPLFYAFLEIPALYTELFRTYDSEEGWSGWSHISLADVALSGDYDDLRNTPVIGDGILTVQKNGVMLDTFRANATANKTINITVPTQASDINALPDTTKYGKSFTLSIDSSTYVVTATLKDQDGNTLGTAQTIDLPLESVVVGGRYDDTTKKVILTLQNGNTIEFSVADLVAGLQSEITANNKLSADLVDDTNTTNKFATASQLSKLDGLQNITTIGSNLTLTNGTLNATDTTYNNFTGADGTNAGAAGLVPAPAATDNTKFLKGDGTWANAGSSFAVNTFTTISNNTSTGSMTPSDVIAAYLIGQVVIGSYYYDRYKLRLVYVNTSTQEVRFEGTVGSIGSATTWTFTGTGLSTTYSVTYVTTSTPNDGVLTITQDGVSKGTFSANQAGNQTIALVSGITYIDHTGD
jgi:hypothetical protein